MRQLDALIMGQLDGLIVGRFAGEVEKDITAVCPWQTGDRCPPGYGCRSSASFTPRPRGRLEIVGVAL
jgi:hypothetical protein